jgi:Nucleotidyltransferase of unknown function (DUF6036)
MIASEARDLWSIYQQHQQLDPALLTRAIENQVLSGDLDYRTRLLIRESLDALRAYWGEPRFSDWIDTSSVRDQLREIGRENFEDDCKFPSLKRRVMDVTKPETIKAFLREIGQSLQKPLRIDVGGSIACILLGYLARKTEDVDVVNEVPAEIRNQHKLLQGLHQRYDLKIGHFQSHYLPSGWQDRLHSQPPFGPLRVFLVDVYDVFLSKITSIREKDKDDLEKLSRQLDKNVLIDRFQKTMQSMLASEELRKRAEQNWYILFGEPLPS